MNQPETSTLFRNRKAVLDRVRRVRGREDAIQQAEAIARHYVAHATIAAQLLNTIEASRQFKSPMPELDRFISYMVNTIKANHAKDFGIELEWTVEQEHTMEQSPVVGCNCRMCDAARSAKQ